MKLILDRFQDAVMYL